MFAQRWCLKAGLIAVAAVIVVAAGTHPCVASGEEPATESIQLIVDFGDGAEKHFPKIAWRDGMTVLDVLLAAKRHPRGIQFEYRGKDATAFLTSIDGLANEGRGRNWLFRVNGKLAEQSFATTPLRAGDAVLWRFGADK
jgi:hypothetical protein